MKSLLTLRLASLIAGLLLLVLIVPAGAQPAASTVLVPVRNFTSTSTFSRGPDPSQRFQRVVAVYTPAEVQGIGPGLNLLSLGFRLNVPAAAPVAGTLRVWLRNATDTNYLLADDWNYVLQHPVAFQQVYDGPPPGLYVLRRRGAGWVHTRRVAVE